MRKVIIVEQIGRPSKRRPPSPPIIRTIGDALAQKKPTVALWPALVNVVFAVKTEPCLSNLTPTCQVLYLTDLVYREIQNGGFSQFFYNTAGRYSMETRWALSEMGSLVFLNLFERALSVFPNSIVPVNDSERRTFLDELSENGKKTLSELDVEFNSRIDFSEKTDNGRENEMPLTMSYMSRHQDEPLASEDTSV
jgi:hypothetical protein